MSRTRRASACSSRKISPKGRVDFTNFVTVNNEKPAAVRVQGSQLCVEDLLHGKRYDVKIRSGIPSTEDDLLPKPVELTVYIRDRKPSVRFSSRNYVLPAPASRASRSSASIPNW